MKPNLKTLAQPLPLARLAYERLRDSILSGELQAGQIYNEKNLASALGISRTPVREALLELSVQGLVKFLPRKGVMVNHYDRLDVGEVFELRRAIEMALVERAAAQADKIDFAAFEQSIDEQGRMVEEEDTSEFLKADRLFHTYLGDINGNGRMAAVLENLRDILQVMAMGALTQKGRNREVIKEHRAILEAIRQGDREAARQAMDLHLNKSEQAVLDHLEASQKVQEDSASSG